MSLNVETGTGAANSESYCSVAYATTYHANRGNSTWALLTTAQMEEALRRATDYIEQTYRLRWLGLRTSSTQALSWPRSGVYVEGYALVSDAIPIALVNACAEMALKAAAGELLPDLAQGVVREKVDALEIEYDKYSSQSPRYTAIDRLLAPFLSGSSASRTVVRT